MKRRTPAIVFLAAASLALAACAGTSSEADPEGGAEGGEVTGGDLTVAQVTEPDATPDPIIDGSLAGYNYYYNLFDRLVMLDADGELQPQLATEWESNEDFTQWTFTLREGVTFHDGSELTAEDVVFTFETILDTEESSVREHMRTLDSVSADGNDVIFELNAPFSPWPSITTSAHIVPQAVYEELGSDGFAQAPVGSGPFSFVSRTQGVDYVLERNDDYWGDAAALDGITFQTISDEDARLNGVLSNSVDVALISPNQVSGLEGQANATIESRVSNGVTFLGVNSEAGALADERVRRAIVHAIDREAITDSVLAGAGEPISQAVAPSVTGFDDSVGVAEFNPDLARDLLEEAGYDGETIVFEYASDGRIPLSTEVAQAIQGFLTDVGIEVSMSGMDQASFSGRVYGTEDMRGLFLNTWAPSTMDGDMPVTNMFAGGANDYTADGAAPDLVAEQRTVGDQERIDVFGELAELNIEQGWLIPLYAPETIYAVNPDLDWTPRVDGLFALVDTNFTE